MDTGSKLERRATLELRAVTGRTLEGIAAPYNSPAKILGFTERIAPGAFKGTLARGDDVLALVDHKATRLLARTASGTLRLEDRSDGLAFQLDTPNTQLGNDVLELVKRGDYRGASFAFRVDPNGERWEGRNRTLTSLSLAEISIVSTPAYAETSVAARSFGSTLPPRLAVAVRFLETV